MAESYAVILNSFTDPVNDPLYLDILDSETPFKLPLPESLQTLDPFVRLTLVKLLRLEKLQNGIKIYIESILGPAFIESPLFDLKGAFSDSISISPIIFVLSPGADPMTYLFDLAR